MTIETTTFDFEIEAFSGRELRGECNVYARHGEVEAQEINTIEEYDVGVADWIALDVGAFTDPELRALREAIEKQAEYQADELAADIEEACRDEEADLARAW